MGSLEFSLMFIFLTVSVFGSPKRLFGDKTHEKDAVRGGGTKNIEDYSDEELFAELNELIGNLNEEQLRSLEAILEEEDVDDVSEFSKIAAELSDIGMDDEDIEDLKLLTSFMHKYLIQVPRIYQKLELSEEADLEDNIQLYLLGLPNKLGPLGYIALHNVLEDEDDDHHEDVVAPVSAPAPPTAAPTVAAVQTQSKPVTFRRRRESNIPAKSKVVKVMQGSN